MPRPQDISICSICGKPLTVEKCKIDEHGHGMHEECNPMKLVLASGPPATLRGPICFEAWKVLLRKDCELQGILVAFDAMGDYVLELLWTRGLDPTVKAIVESSGESQPMTNK